jgi:hypothetical protein
MPALWAEQMNDPCETPTDNQRQLRQLVRLVRLVRLNWLFWLLTLIQQNERVRYPGEVR